MARVKGIAISNLEGRIGNVVFRNRQGVNVASQRPASVKNPRTEAQQEQRMIFNTIVQAYSCLKDIADHSFEGVSSGAKSQAVFLKKNLSLLRNQSSGLQPWYVARTNNAYVPNRYLLSEGSLPTLNYNVYSINTGIDPFDFQSASTAKFLNIGTLTPTTYTVAEMLSRTPIQLGDQLSILYVVATTEFQYGSGSYGQFGGTKLVENRVTLKTDADTTLPVFVQDGGSSQYTFNPDVWTAEVLADNLNIFYDSSSTPGFDIYPEGENSIAFAYVLSRKSGDTWLRSTQYMQTLKDELMNSNWSLLSYNKSVVVRTYNPSDTFFLNNAEA